MNTKWIDERERLCQKISTEGIRPFMRKLFVISAFLLAGSTNLNAAEYIWSSAVPKEVHIIPNGLVLIGEFNNTGITCATGPKAIYLPNSDQNFDSKLSLALTAKASGKSIRVLLEVIDNCYQVSALGFVPPAHPYYWQLLN